MRIREINSKILLRAALAICILMWIPASFAQTAKPNAMTPDDVIRLVKAGLSDDIIIQQLRKSGQTFDLSTDQLIALKGAKVSDRVVQFMIEPKADASTPGTSSAKTPAAADSDVPAGLPAETGVYIRKQEQWVAVQAEIVSWKTSGALKSIATAGTRMGDVNGVVPGTSSRVTLSSPLEFTVVMPEGVTVNEYQLIHLHVNRDNRDFQTVTGGFLHAQSGSQRDTVPFDSKKIANRVYQVTFPGNAQPGEYGLLPPNSGTGTAKIYSFQFTHSE